ncbi:MAG: transglycosylase SLT domain-containing protein [Bacteroidales bacterium]|nr:transglycosylase SLT domain-containing protein [Bacteroidales bacterium]MCI1734092.1 transglycosylase SLT domain-containing protein [Bacteroidales bacterium]
MRQIKKIYTQNELIRRFEKLSVRRKNLVRIGVAFLIVLLIVFLPKWKLIKNPEQAASPNILAGDTLNCTIVIDSKINTGKPSIRYAYEMVKYFNRQQKCTVNMSVSVNSDSLWMSLSDGTTDVVIYNDEDSIPDVYGDDFITSLPVNNTDRDDFEVVCAARYDNEKIINAVNFWFARFKQTYEYRRMYDKFHKKPSIFKLRRRSYGNMMAPMTRYQISPYDDMIKKYSKEIGWDWRLVSALIYQESKFNPHVISSGGAVGLMQVKESTARKHGVHNVYNPEMNIKAGTRVLGRLAGIYAAKGIKGADLVQITLAAYNAGDGRMSQCMTVAKSEGKDPRKWSDISEILPLMRGGYSTDDGITVGSFSGRTMVRHVNIVMQQYDYYKRTVVE